ncbi:MAG: hypothetical protein JSR47_20295 [Proteobacteria bacterium]|nr:hypothetical protein [Pseudomonadota bacterium]
MNDITLARLLHVLAVIIWIGGVSMVATVVLPAIRRGDLGANRLQAFRTIERRFVRQARTAVLLTGMSGIYMVWRLDLWQRFAATEFWWMHAMVCLWVLFTFILFVAEPLFLHRRFDRWASVHPEIAFTWFTRAHRLLLLLSVVTIAGAMVGSHG